MNLHLCLAAAEPRSRAKLSMNYAVLETEVPIGKNKWHVYFNRTWYSKSFKCVATWIFLFLILDKILLMGGFVTCRCFVVEKILISISIFHKKRCFKLSHKPYVFFIIIFLNPDKKKWFKYRITLVILTKSNPQCPSRYGGN